MFQCAAEPWWAFKASAEEMARDYHVYLFIADGHDELGTEFVSLEKYAKDAAEYLRAQGIGHVDAMYGVSMGGAAVIRFLATEDISVEKAIIDAGITPYPYPKWICRLISVKDWITVILGTRSLKIMKAVYPPERWTPKGEDPETHYRALLKFYKQHFLDWVLFANLTMFRLEGTEHMDKAYHQKWFHAKGMLFPGIIFALIPSALVGWLVTLIR